MGADHTGIDWQLVVLPFDALVQVLIVLICTVCVLGIWAGLSRRHWLWRSSLPVAALVALIPTGMHDGALVAAYVMVLTAAGGRLVRRFAEHQQDAQQPRLTWPRLRFPLRDIFLATALAAVVMAAAASINWREAAALAEWPNCLKFPASGACLASTAVLSAAVVLFRRIWLTTGLLVCIAGSAALHTYVLGDWFALDYWGGSDRQLSELLAGVLAFGELAMLVAVALWLLLAASRSVQRNTEPGPRRKTYLARAVVAIGALALLPDAMLWYRVMIDRPVWPVTDFPNSNAFPALSAAAERTFALNPSGKTLGDLRRTAPGAAAQLETVYRHALSALDQPGYVALRAPRGEDASGISLREIRTARSLVRAWNAEAAAAIENGNTDEAVRYAVACIRVGAIYQRGGLIIHSLVGAACEGVGLHQLVMMRDKLDPEQARNLLETLQEIDGSREAIEMTVARDYAWESRAYGWRARYPHAVGALTGAEADISAIPTRVIWRQRHAELRLFAAELALELYRHEHGVFPQRLEELVPSYLAQVPLDPFSDQPLIYRLDDDRFVLYSVGAEGQGNHGR